MSKITLNTPKQPTAAANPDALPLDEEIAAIKEPDAELDELLVDASVDTPSRPPLALAPGQEPIVEVKTTIKDTETAEVQVIKLVFTDIAEIELKVHEKNPSDWQVEKLPEQGEDIIMAYNPQSILRYVGTVQDFNKLLRGTNKG